MSSASQYPIALLLEEIIAVHASSEEEFITEVLGYRNEEKGLRRLHLLFLGEGANRIVTQISRATGRGEDLERAIAATREMKAKEYEESWLEVCRKEAETFVPFVCSRGESRFPTQIIFHGLTRGRLELVQVPLGIFELPLEEQLEAMPQFMREYATQYHGSVPFWGKLRGFVYARLLDHFTFDRDALFIERVERPFRRGYSEVTLR